MITVPEKLYVGLQKREKDTPLGFITPETDDKAFEKRKRTVDTWAEGYYGAIPKKNRLQPLHLTNQPNDGYVIADDIRRYGWGSGNVVWRMVDPRGFEFEISSPNLASILDCTTIVNGVIQGPCVFGREGAHNVLLPVGSEPYKAATANTSRSKVKIPLRDIKPGAVVLLKDGTKITYGGLHNILVYTGGERLKEHDKSFCYFVSLKKRYVFVRHNDDEDQEARSRVDCASDLHVSSIIQAEGAIPRFYNSRPDGIYNSIGVVDSKTKLSDFQFALRAVSLDEYKDLVEKARRSRSYGAVEALWQPNAEFYLQPISHNSYYSQYRPLLLRTSTKYLFNSQSSTDGSIQKFYLGSPLTSEQFDQCRFETTSEHYSGGWIFEKEHIDNGQIFILEVHGKDGKTYQIR